MFELLSPLVSLCLWVASLTIGERWSYGSAFIVLIGVIGESIADLTTWIEDKCYKKRLEKASALILILGLTGDLVAIGIGQREIAALTKEAGDAKTSAEKAEGAAQRAKDQSNEAASAALNALKLARDARREIDSVHRDVGKATSELRQVEAEAQKTKSDLINLALCNAPRVINNWFVGSNPGLPGGGKSYVDPLRPMAGQKVFIDFVPDAETRRAAFTIVRTLKDAEWNVQTLNPVDGLADGVSVQPSVPTFTGSDQDRMLTMSLRQHATEASDKLLAFLHSYNWQAAQGAPTDSEGKLIRDEKILPAGAIRIQIGLYPPAVYVSPPGQKELTSRLEEMKRRREKARAEYKRDREKRLAALPPEIRKEVEQADAEREARMNSVTSTGPCQVLNPLF